MQTSLTEIYNSMIIIIKTILNDKQLLLSVIIFFILFLGLSFYLYSTFVKPYFGFSYVTNKEFVSNTLKKENNDDVLIMLFKTEWCPYCKQGMPEWNKFVEYIEKLNEKNDYIIRSSVIDCDKQEDIAKKYNIESYPSIILIYKNERYEYDASPKKINLIKFLESSTGKDNPIIYSSD